MKQINYDEQLHRNYHRGRALDESVMQLWRETTRQLVGDRSGITILDLGSGTGRFSGMLADEFSTQVIGVEPSDKMRAVAESECDHPNVKFLKGSAEAIPLDDDSCDVAWLSQVIHHFPDLDSAAAELHRVLRTGGQVIVRSNFRGRLKGCCRYYDFFPAGLAVDEERHPSVEQVRQAFEQCGFRLDRFETVEQTENRSLLEYADRIRSKTYSTFELIAPEEYREGLQALERAAKQEQEPQPVTAKIDVLLFRLN